jgi:dihydropteroate synthase
LFAATDAALEHFYELANDGAAIIDVGAESTRPGAVPLAAEQEWARLSPFLQQVKPVVKISVDTRYATTAKQALAWDVSIINDVSGLTDAAMRRVLAEASCGIIVMHALGVPADANHTWPPEIDPIAEILAWKQRVTELAARDGIAPERLIYDPGIGFGKTHAQSMMLVERASELVSSGGNWMYGHSRKGFLTLLTKATAAERDEATLVISRKLKAAGVQYLRVHDVKRHRDLCM